MRTMLAKLGGLALLLIAGLAQVPGGQPVAAFQRVWERQDGPVAAQQSARSWTWGPQPLGPAQYEPFAEGQQGQRLVQYFDKSRMEINDPRADPNAAWYVTNGLLPVELITGRMQTGYSQYEQRNPARIAAIGDPDNPFPTYAGLRPLYQQPGAGGQEALNDPVTALLNPDLTRSELRLFVQDSATWVVERQNNYSIVRAFTDFMRQRGLISVDGRLIEGQVYDPLFVFGLPVTQPFWVNVKVGGAERPILFQVFERRVLTYNPANPRAFRVEMGNAGQHYYQWRYGQ